MAFVIGASVYKFQVGERVRVKTGLDLSQHPVPTVSGNHSDYWRNQFDKAQGKVRKIQYINERDGVAFYHFRALPPLPEHWLESEHAKRNSQVLKKVAKIKNLSANAILGQDKIKKQLKHAVDNDMPALLIGETGTGKTTIVKDIADGYDKQTLRFNLTGETTVDEFVGKYTLENGQTKWQDGVLLMAMRKGLWLIVDEINVALPEILFVLHSLLDDDKSVLVAQHDGEVVKPHEDFRFFATMNPVEEYAGTKELNKAFMSRFGMILKLEYPKAEHECAILIHKAGVEAEIAGKLVDIATRLRMAKADGEIFYTCSTRDLIQLGKLAKSMPLADAVQVSIINKANGDGERVKKHIAQIIDLYKEAAAGAGTLNIEVLRDKIAEVKAALQTKEVELHDAEDMLSHTKTLIANKEKELAEKVPQMEQAIRKEIIASLQGV